MTQPPLSRQIQRLESTVGVLLFERNNRRVDLTEAGKAFLVESRRLLGVANAAPEVARLVAAGSVGVLHIGFTAASAFGLMGAVLNRFAETMPDVTVELREMVTRDQLSALDNGEIDIAIARPTVDPEVYRSRLLTSEALVVALPTDHPLTRRTRPLSADDLMNEGLIMHSPLDAKYFYDMVVRLLPVSRWKYTHTVSQIVTMVGLVASGRGIAIVPASAAQLGFGKVQFAPIMTPEAQPVELHAIWRRDDNRPLVHRALQELQPDKYR